MAKDIVKLKALVRSTKINAIRAAESIPAVLYGHGIENQPIQVDSKDFYKVLKAAGHTSLVDLVVDDVEHNVLIKEVQQHPLREQVTHVDFYQVRMDETVRADVPLVFTGESPAVKDKGGIFLRNIDTLEIEALPRDLPHELTIDVAGLVDYDDVIRVADVVLPEGVVSHGEADTVICVVQAPRTDAEIEALEAEVTEDVESVEGVKDKVPEEGAEAEGAEGAEKKDGEAEATNK